MCLKVLKNVFLAIVSHSIFFVWNKGQHKFFTSIWTSCTWKLELDLKRVGNVLNLASVFCMYISRFKYLNIGDLFWRFLEAYKVMLHWSLILHESLSGASNDNPFLMKKHHFLCDWPTRTNLLTFKWLGSNMTWNTQ